MTAADANPPEPEPGKIVPFIKPYLPRYRKGWEPPAEYSILPPDVSPTRPTYADLLRHPRKCERCKTRTAQTLTAGPNGPMTVAICNTCRTQ